MSRADDTVRQAPVWVSVVSVVLIVAAVAGALFALQHLSTSGGGFAGQGALGAKKTLDIGFVAGLAEPQGASYSPDGSDIATLGVFTPCAPSPRQLSACSHGLAIINALTGDLIRLSPIEPLLGIESSTDPADGPYVSVYGVGWTPDSTWYGVIYSVFNTPRPTTTDNFEDSGLLLINPHSGAVTIIRGDSGFFATISGSSADRPIWDIQHHNQSLPAPLVPALAYSWLDSNVPSAIDPEPGPVTRLPNIADSFSPVGNPNGVGPYTIWQSGVLIGPGSAGLGGQRSAFLTTFSAWADSGERVGVFTAGVSLPTPDQAMGVISAPPSVKTPPLISPDTYIVAPARDMALTSVQERIGAYGWAQLAWNPDGSILASVTCFTRHGETIDLRDTISGSILGQADLELANHDPGCRDLGQSRTLGAYPHPNLNIAWSPDGHQVALVDDFADTLTIWPVNSSR